MTIYRPFPLTWAGESPARTQPFPLWRPATPAEEEAAKANSGTTAGDTGEVSLALGAAFRATR
jgi:hypothetical protein